jgi:peptide-methionine (S)-S-oxide reductase
MKSKNNPKKELKTAILGGGCFWCTETVFDHTQGVISVMPGYAGGTKENPTYEEVCSGKTGHAEVVKIEYDPEKIKYADILRIFFSVHDPTTLYRQGPDVGTQYRSIILYVDEEQKKMAEKVRRKLETEKIYSDPIVTEIVPLEKFYPAETYHRRYFEKNPEQAYCQAVIAPKLAKFREKNKKFYERFSPGNI